VKVLAATQGHDPDDFCFAVPGELVTVAARCGDAYSCGCGRAWVGLTTRKGTTTAIVVDVDLTPGQYLELIGDDHLAEQLLWLADGFDPGAVLGHDGDTIEVRS
jgi:hypothetical protein